MVHISLDPDRPGFLVRGGAVGGQDVVHNRLIQIPGMVRRARGTPVQTVGVYRFGMTYPAARGLLGINSMPVDWEPDAHLAAQQLLSRLFQRDSYLTLKGFTDGVWPTAERPMSHQAVGLLALEAVKWRQLIEDDTGTGKTPLALWAFHRSPSERCLVLCPAFVKHKWGRAVTQFLGEPAVVIGGTAAQRANQFVAAREASVVVINYELLRYLSHDQRAFLTAFAKGQFAIYDESQYLRSARSQRTEIVKEEYHPEHLLLLTATPVENTVLDLYAQLTLLEPDLWRNSHEFENRYLVTFPMKVGKRRTKLIQRVAGGKNLDELNQIQRCYAWAPRKLCDLTGLPEVRYVPIELELDPESRRFYDRLRDWWLFEFGDSVDDGESVFGPRAKTALDAATRLVQVAQSYVGGVPEPLLPVVHTQSKHWRKIPGRPNELFMPQGVKAQWLIEHVESLWRQDRRAVVFSQFNAPLAWFHNHWAEDSRFLHGALTNEKKDEIIDGFLNGSGRVLNAQIRMAQGWDCYTVQDAIMYGFWWEPSKNHQAVGRLHRRGQKGTVTVYEPIVMATIEERIKQALELKKGDMDTALASWSFADLKGAVEG